MHWNLFGSRNWLLHHPDWLHRRSARAPLKPGRDSMGIIFTTLRRHRRRTVGRMGRTAMGWYRPGEAAGFSAHLIGAIVILVVVSLFRRRVASDAAR